MGREEVVDQTGKFAAGNCLPATLIEADSVDGAVDHRRYRRQPSGEQPHPETLLDGGTTVKQENRQSQSFGAEVINARPKAPRELSRRHVKVVRQERSSDATVIRGGGDRSEGKTEPAKRVRIHEQKRT